MPAIGPQGTYKWSDVLGVATQLVHSIPVAPLQLYAADQINSIIWKTFPWRWTLNALTPITLINLQQDYTPVPSDFWRWVNPRLIRNDVTPPQNQPIKAAKHLEVEVQRQGGINTIQAVSYEPTNSCFRLDITPEISGTIVLQLAGDYQQLPPKLASVNVTCAHPDSYFNTALEGVLWMFYRLADDPRSGAVSINRPGDKDSNGQQGVFMAALEEMKRMEDVADDMQTRFPEQPLGWSRTGNPGIWPI
jgi:hypothetical protein